MLGFLLTKDLFISFQYYYFLLNIFAFASAVFIIKNIKEPSLKNIHLWIIFLIFTIGYFFKFYILAYLKLYHSDFSSDYLNTNFPLESYLLGKPILVINYFEIVTVLLLIFSVISFFILNNSKLALKINSEYALKPISIRNQRKINILFICAAILSILYFCFQLKTGIGIASRDPNSVMSLPYHLAGIISALGKWFLPALFMLMILLSFAANLRVKQYISISLYIVFGMIATLISTSRFDFLFIVITLAVLLFSIGKLSKKYIFILAILICIATLSSNLIAFIRTGDLVYNGPLKYITLLLRVNGADSLLNILNYSTSFSFDRIIHRLFESSLTINDQFSLDVLGLEPTQGLGFSTSLIGRFYFIFESLIVVSFVFSIYIFIWHYVFVYANKIFSDITPIFISLLSVTLAFITSEGNFESLPFMFLFATAASFFLKICFTKLKD
jgi:hypothetical protein